MIKGLIGFAASALAFNLMAAETPEQELRGELAKYNGYSAQFSQTVVDTQGVTLHQAQGEMHFEQPGKFVWQVNEPEPEVLLSDGVTVWWYNPFVEQVSIFTSDQAVSKTPFALLVSQDDETWRQFNISKVKNYYLVQSKNQEDAQVRELRIAFKQGALSEISILDRSMQTSSYKVSGETFNDVPDQKFHFVIPQDTEIDDQRQSAAVVSESVGN